MKELPDGKQAAQGLIEIVDLFAITRFGPDAMMTVTERFLIADPLARLIEKYGSVADRFSGVIDPLLVVAGLAMYGIRLGGLATSQQQPPAPPAPPAQQAAPVQQAAEQAIPVAFENVFSMFGGKHDD